MIIYNVTVKVDNDIAQDWVQWMKEEHMPELMTTGLFVDYRLCRLLEQDETEGITYTAQYFCDGMEHYNTYISEHAPQMREKGFARFGNKFATFRTVMKVE
jgi:transposase